MDTLTICWSWTKNGFIYDKQIKIKDLQKFFEKAIEMKAEYISVSYFKQITKTEEDKTLNNELNQI